MPNTPNIPPEARALSEAVLATALSALHIRVPKAERWEQTKVHGLTQFTTAGIWGGAPFSATDAAAVFEWLLRHPLPELPVRELIDGGDEWREALAAFLARFGAVTEPDPALDYSARRDRVFRAAMLGEAGRERLQQEPDQTEDSVTVDEAALTAALGDLSAALMLVLTIARHGPDRGLRELEQRQPDLVRMMREAIESEGERRSSSQLVRSWITTYMNVEQFRMVLVESDGDRPARVEARPSSAIQLLWLMLAVTIGVIEPPSNLPGVHRCDYCDSLFFGDRSGVRGEHVFCSERHGKSFWAQRRMREKRAAEKAQRESEIETS